MAAASTPLTLHTSAFVDEFIDVAELNASASNSILSRVEEVRRAAREHRHSPTQAFAVLGPAGGGKTHVVARIRRNAGAQSTLVLVRPYFGATLSLRDVLATTVDHLCRRPNGATVSQLDRLASYWLAPEGSVFPAATALETSSMDPSARAAQLESAVQALIDHLPELAPVAHLARALLGASSLPHAERWAELAWLSGREPRESAPSSPGMGALGDGDVLHVLSMLSVLAGPVAPIAIVFDQLENLATEGAERVLGYGNVVSELVDSVPGLTIVQLALTSEWLQFIEPQLSLSQRSRLSSEKIILELPSERQRKLLLRAWQDHLSSPSSQSTRKKRLGHPLSTEQVEHLVTAPGMTPRLLATAYARAVAGKEMLETVSESTVEPSDPRSAVRALWEDELRRVDIELEEKRTGKAPVDAAEVAEGVAVALSFDRRLAAETRSERERYFTTVRGPGGDLVVVYLTGAHHKSVSTGLARAIDLARDSKVAVVRERRFEIPASWASVEEKRAEFERMPNARWLWLEDDEVARCLTLARMSSLAGSKRLRVPGAVEPLTLDAVRNELDALFEPASWASSASIGRWLDDVPRESRGASAESGPVSKEPTPPASKRAPPEPEEPLDALRGWLRAGRTIGKQTVSHYVAKLARRLGRD